MTKRLGIKNYWIDKNKRIIMSFLIHTQYLTVYLPGFWTGTCAKNQGNDKDDYVHSLHGFSFPSLLKLQRSENIFNLVLMRRLSNL